MLNTFFKSAIYYTFFRKYGQKFSLVLSIIGFIFLINFIYSDIVEYLTLREMKEKLIYALLIKWLVVLTSTIWIVHIIRSAIWSKEKVDTVEEVKSKPVKIEKPISAIEEGVIEKDELKSHGDKLIEEMKQRKKV